MSSPNTHIEEIACPEVWIAILHWKGIEYTRNCLSSIVALAYPRTKILLIDNGSADSSAAVLAKEFAGVKYLALPENLGFAGGFNTGIQYCMQNNAQWIWLLNNDTTVAPESLDVLIAQAIQHPEAAVFGAAVHYDDVVSGPGQIDFLRAKTYLRPLKDFDSKAITSEWLSGSNLLLRCTALVDENYIFDPGYFLYFEDTEFCTRIRKHGWKCLYIPEARIYHKGNASTSGELSYWRAYYYTRNRLLFFGKALGIAKAVPAFISIAAHLLRHFIVLPFRGEAGHKQLRAEFLGLRDCLQGRFGKAACLDWCN